MVGHELDQSTIPARFLGFGGRFGNDCSEDRMFKYRGWLVLVAMVAGTTACLKRANVQCDQSSNCDLTAGGVCTKAPSGNQWCAYPSADCPSNLSYATQDVGDSLAGKCVNSTGAGSGSACKVRVAFNAGTGTFNVGTGSDGPQEVWVTDIDGSNAVNISRAPTADNTLPTWSSDGTKLAFRSDMSGYTDIYSVNSDGSNLINLTPTNNTPLGTPMWSPDGTHIAYLTGNSIWTMNVDGTQRELFAGAGVGLAWSPDGKSLAYEVYVQSVPSPGIGPFLVSVAPFGNAAAAKILAPSATQTQNHLGWAPASRLVWDSAQDIYISNPDGTGLLNITQDNSHINIMPILSRDGEMVVYSSNVSGNVELWSVPASGGLKTHLTHNSIASTPSSTYGDFPQSISADGSLVAFTRVSQNPDGSISSEIGVLNVHDLTTKFFNAPGAADGTVASNPVFSSCPNQTETRLRTANR